MAIHQGYLNVNDVPTKIITWGKWVEEGFKENEKRELILCIPGNPGVTRFYTLFLQTIYEQLQCPVWIVGHAGHENPNNRDLYHMPPLKDHKHLYNLQGQINHKVAFIEKYVPNDVKVHLIGHSIGAYIILNLLKIPTIKSRIIFSYLLFPTIEHMAKTTNGQLVSNVLPYLVSIFIFLAWIFMLLPAIIQDFLVCVYCKIVCMPKMHYRTVRFFVDPYVINNVCHMALDEMHHVRRRDRMVLRDNMDKIKLYYGASDLWAPVSYCERLRRDIPGINAEICVRGFAHAFVLRHSRPMGSIVATWIKENKF